MAPILLYLYCMLTPAQAEVDPIGWLSSVQVGTGRAEVLRRVEKLAEVEHKSYTFQDPGAFAKGLLERPSMLSLLNRAGVAHPYFDQLPKAGPSFLLMKGGGARASLGFVKDRLWSVAIAIPSRQIAPTANPFEEGRLRPLVEALERLCPSLQVSGKDDHGNAMAWRSRQCAGGSAAIWYEPVDTDAALKVLVHGR